MNKKRNKVAAMMMVVAITVSSVAMPVEAIGKFTGYSSINIEREDESDSLYQNVILNKDFFPDQEFREYLSNKLKIKEDEEISEEKLFEITKIDVGYFVGEKGNIKSLVGIEHFKNLSSLICCENRITGTLDLSKNENLEFLNCNGNDISELKLPNSEKLIEIHCGSNDILKLDLSVVPKLEKFDCSWNKNLKEINLSSNKDLQSLDLRGIGLTNIDISENNLLTNIDVSNNNIKKIDLPNHYGLKDGTNFYIAFNTIRYLDLTNTNLPFVMEECITSNEIGKMDVNEKYVKSKYNTLIKFKNISDKIIDLNKEFGITENDIKNKRLKLETEDVTINGTKLEWTNKDIKEIKYEYNCCENNDNVKLGVTLKLEYDENSNTKPPIIEEEQNPEQKPDEKPNKPNKPSNITSKIVGKNRYETAAKIADKIGSYNTVILVNSDKSMADGLSAASLSGKKNAPILLVKQDKIPKSTMDRINKASNVYIIGGENAISKNVEKKLKESGKKINRIAGKDRYDTSREIAKLLGGYDKAFIVNGAKGEADAMSVSAVAAKYGAPILLTNGKTSIHDKKSGVKYYAIGGTAVVDNKLKEKYSAERVAGSDRYATNREIMEEFYWNSEKVYFAKGDTLIDALTASALAKDNGIVLVSKNKNHSELEGKDTVQVGGMNFEIDFE